MLKRILSITSLALVAILTSSMATAQYGLRHQANSKTFDAQIVAIDNKDRTITVRFKKNDEEETYPVAKNAEFYYFDGEMDVPKSFIDLSVGDDVMLAFSGVQGKVTLSKVTSNKAPASKGG